MLLRQIFSGTLKLNFLFCILSLIFSTDSLAYHSKTKNINLNQCYKNYTDYFSFKKEELPKEISISTPNISQYYKYIVNSNETPHNISPKNRRYLVANLNIKSNDILCKYLAEFRLHGSSKVHLNMKNKISSVRIKILDGNIINTTRFALLLPGSRNGSNEIFVSTLFRELGFLSPLTFYTKMKIMDSNYEKVIFQESLDYSFLQKNKKSEGIIFAGNKNYWNLNKKKKLISDQNRRLIVLSRIKNLGGIELENNMKHNLEILSKLNKAYISGHNYHIENKNYESYPIMEILFDKNKIGYKKMSSFESLMFATFSKHGLSVEDRRYYYNHLSEEFEPIYYDGKSEILDKDHEDFIIDEKIVRQFHKDGAKIAKEKIINLNIDNFTEKLINYGFQTNTEEVKKILNKIIKNLSQIENIKLKSNFDINTIDNSNYFSKKIFKDINLSLAFDGKENNFILCTIDLKNCRNKKFNKKKTEEILFSQIAKINKDNILYISKDINFYKKKFLKNDQNSFSEKILIENGVKLLFNKTDTINIDEKNKEIELYLNDINSKFLFKGGKLENWKIRLVQKESINNRQFYCVKFFDLEFKDVSLYSESSTCQNTFELTKVKGSINNVIIANAYEDALDADYSDIRIDFVKIDNAGDECLNFKTGNYFINNSILSNCTDKAVSSSEFAKTIIDNIYINNSTLSLVAQNSGALKIRNSEIVNAKYCLKAFSYKKKYKLNLIKLMNYKCFGGKEFIDKNSYVLKKNEF